MNIVRYKWNLHKTYRRVRVLWDEFLQLDATPGSIADAGVQLNLFLDSFLQAHKEFIQNKSSGQTEAEIDSVLGDCSEIVNKLLDILTREIQKLQLENNLAFSPTLLHKILISLSHIIKSEKYRQLLRCNVERMGQILDLLKDIEDSEGKLLVLQILRMLGEDLLTWMEVGRLNGFLVLFAILENPKTDADLRREVLITLQDLLSRVNEEQTDSQELITPWRKKLTSAVGEVRTVMFNWRGVFKAKEIESIVSGEGGGNQQENQSETGLDVLRIPSKESITVAYSVLQKESETELSNITEDSSDNSNVKEELCQQGGLTTLVTLLHDEGYLHKKLLLVEIISKLLLKNKFAQRQFKENGGYVKFISLFDSLNEKHFESPHTILSIDKTFQLFSVMAVDGNKDKRIGNLDALSLFFKVLVRPAVQVETRLRALKYLQDIICANTDNIIFVQHIGGVDTLFDILRETSEFMYPPDYDEDSLQVVFAMSDIIDYMGAYFLHHNDDIQRFYLNLIERESKRVSNTVKFIALHSTVKLTSNALYYACQPPTFLNAMTWLLQRYVVELQEISPVDTSDNMFTLDDMEDSSFGSSAVHLRMPEPWIDQVLLILEVIGMMLFNVSTFLDEFQPSLLLDLVSPLLPMEVVELALWLLQHIILKTQMKEEEATENLSLLIKLLENPSLSSTLKERVCYGIVELMYSSDKESHIKEQFRELGGLTLLLDQLKVETEPNLCYAVLHAFGEAITNCERNKAYISETIGFSKLAKLIQSSVVQLDSTLFRIFFEIATKGNIRNVLDEELSCPVTHSSTVSSIIMDILTPQPLNTKQHASFRTLRSRAASIDSVTASMPLISGDSPRDSQETSNNSSESSMIIIDESTSKDSANTTTWYRNIRLRKSCSYSPEDSALDWGDQTEQTHSYGETESDASLQRPHLVGLKIRNTDAIFMVIDLLPKSDLETQQEVLELLMSLLESNPENKEMIYETEKFSEILLMACNANKSVRHYYFSLLAVLGSYSLRKNHSEELLDGVRNCNNAEIQMEILFVLHRLAQRKDPLKYFHLGGESGLIRIGLVDRFPSSKSGYTFCCWLKINLYKSNEVGLYSWLDQMGNTIFELYFKKFSYENNTERYCLAVRTQNLPMPSEHFSFDAYAFTELSKWHHVAFVHVKQTVALYVDGVLIQKSSSLNYPRTVSKDKALAGKIGYRRSDDSHESFFCGSLSTVRFVEGTLPESVIRSLFAYGSSFDASVSDVGSDQREFLTIDPAVTTPVDENERLSSDDLDGGIKEELICKSPDKYPKLSRMRPNDHKTLGDVSVHITNSLKQWALKINLFSSCLDVMKRGPAEQVASLSILCLIIRKHKIHRQAFCDMNGYSMLYFLLQQFDISMEIFDVLLDILCDGAISHHQFTFVDEECAALIFDLLLHAKGIHKRILSHIDHMLVRNSSNVSFLLRAVGFYPILELQSSLSNIEGSPLFHITARMFRCHPSLTQVEEIFNYILGDESDPNSDRKTKILHHLQVALTSSPTFIEYLKDFYILFALLHSPNEGIRLIAINLFGILLDASNGKTNNFTRLFGYYRMKNILQEYPVTIATCTQLLDYSIGTFQFFGESSKHKKSVSPRNSWNANFSCQRMDLRSENRAIIHPDTFLVLLGILKDSKNPVAKIQTLTHIEQLLMQDENKEVLWNSPWLDWCATFMTNQPHDPDTRSLLDSIIQQMMLFELSAQKSTRFLQLKEMADNEPFQIHILEVLIEYFDENPCFDITVAPEIIKSLRLLYKDIEYIEGAGVVCMKTLNHINLLAYQNTAEIRAQMKTHGLFDVRDNLIFHLLRGISDQDAIHFIQTFSFHSIANQAKFRENKGIAYLLKWFHRSFPTNSSASQELLVFIYRILSGVFGPIEQNRKIIMKILGDARICEFFFSPSLLLGRTGEEEDENINRNIFENAFFSWYFAEEREAVRYEIQQRIQKILDPIEAKFEAKAEKARQKKVKKKKEAKEKKEKFEASVERCMDELNEKEIVIKQKSKEAFAVSHSAMKKKRQQQYDNGEAALNDAIQNLEQ